MHSAKRDDRQSLQHEGPGQCPWRERIREHYAEAGDDYRTWSPAYNMHFGFWRLGLGPLDREALLVEMTRQVIYLRRASTRRWRWSRPVTTRASQRRAS